jgi:hypothetical protein
VALGKVKFDQYVLSDDIADLAQPLADAPAIGEFVFGGGGLPLESQPMTGIAFCCARTARAAIRRVPLGATRDASSGGYLVGAFDS